MLGCTSQRKYHSQRLLNVFLFHRNKVDGVIKWELKPTIIADKRICMSACHEDWIKYNYLLERNTTNIGNCPIIKYDYFKLGNAKKS